MENTFYQMYQKELGEIAPCSEEEQRELLARLLTGDLSVASRLIEGNLFRVPGIAEEFDGAAVPLSDLVQEGNMALTMAVGDYSDGNCGEFVPYIEEEIRRAMREAVQDQGRSDQTAQRVLERVELLNRTSEELARELGREPKLEELAQRMSLSEDEVRDVMKMTLEALSSEQ